MSDQELGQPTGPHGAEASPQSANTQERLEVSSGWVLVMDQFMLANGGSGAGGIGA